MCVIYFAESKSILLANAKMDDAAEGNSHGCGVMFASGNKIHIIKSAKSSDWQRILKDVPENESLGFHFRWATGSKKNKQNAHPFLLDKSGAALMHNGIVRGWGDDNISDTREICETLLNPMPFETVRKVAKKIFDGSRILILGHDGKDFVWHRWGSWHVDGNWPHGDYCQSSSVISRMPYQSRATESKGLFMDGQAGSIVQGVYIPRNADGEAWRKNTQTCTIDWKRFMARPQSLARLSFEQWWEQFGRDFQTAANAERAKQQELYAPSGGSAFGYGQTWLAEDRQAFQATKGATQEDWNNYVTRPQELACYSFRSWWNRKERKAEAAIEAQAAKDIQAALSNDAGKTTVSGEIPCLACDDAPQPSTGSATELGGEHGTETPAQTAPTSPRATVSEVPLEPWKERGMNSVVRWAQKYPHDAAALILDLWDDCGLPEAECKENQYKPSQEETGKKESENGVYNQLDAI